MLKKWLVLALVSCGALCANDKIQMLNQENFSETIQSGLVLVDFYAPWCGPCKQMAPVLDRVADGVAGVVIAKVNIDESPKLYSSFEVKGIPTLILFKNGKEVGRLVGFQDKTAVERFIDSHR